MRLIDADEVKENIKKSLISVIKVKGNWSLQEINEVIDIAPTIEAIPIEWIKRYWSDLIETNSIAKWEIKRMVYEWEDENGQLKESERNIARIIDWRE